VAPTKRGLEERPRLGHGRNIEMTTKKKRKRNLKRMSRSERIKKAN